ncbi:MAG TPA: VTT domain-containing protein [Terriglobales bacterium]|nr:VTT domain-containing protein [Terriglobales bacterium]
MGPRLLALLKASPFVMWIVRLGGPGLILLGLADNSVIPLPGSMDVLTIWLAARHRDIWPYYSAMATVGAVLGGYVTYYFSQKGGKQAMEARLSKRKAEKVYRKFEKWGFGAVAIPAMIPPPFPIVPVLVAAGAMQYSRRKFLGALALGRGIRFTVVGFLGAHYGPAIVRFFSRYYKPALFTLIGCAVVAGIFALVEYLRYRKHRSSPGSSEEPARQPKVA